MTVPLFTRKDGTVPIEDEVRRIMREEMKGKDREDIARKMAELLGREVPVHTLADFTRNPTKRRHIRFPLAWLGAFCAATGSDELARFVLPQHLQERLKLGECLWPMLQQELERVSRSSRKSNAKRKRPRKS